MKKSILITLLFAIFLFLSNTLMNIPNTISETFSYGWTFTAVQPLHDNAVFNLPITVKNAENVQIQRRIPDLLKDNMIFFYTSDQGVRVFIDDVQIYEYGMNQWTEPFMKSPASLWHKIKLEKLHTGKTISFFFSYPYENHRGHIFKIYLSNYNSFLKYLIIKYFLSLEFAVLCLIFSIVLVPFCFVSRQYSDQLKQIFCISFYAILAAILCIADSKLTLFITDYPRLFSMLGILSLMLLGLPPIMYAACIKDLKMHKFLHITVVLCIILYCTAIVLEFLAVIDVYRLRNYIYGGLYISTLMYFVALGISLVRDKRHDVKMPFLAYLLLFLISSIDLIIYFMNEEFYSAEYISFASLVFIIFLVITSFSGLRRLVEENRHVVLYKDLISQDFMTGTKNQSSFLSDIEKLILSEKLAVVVFDINNLKDINEKFGHEKGDEAVIKIASLIKNEFLQYGECYRTGTDEFTALITDKQNVNIYECLQNFISALDKVNMNLKYKLGTAMGYAVFDSKLDNRFKDTVSRAKKNMIKNKTSQKLAEKFQL